MGDLAGFVLTSLSPEQTQAFGAALGAAVRDISIDKPLVIALNGELGAGKTTFVGGFMRSLGVIGPVRSPTYTLIEPYECAHKRVFHMDLYRLADQGELEMLAPRDVLEPGAVLLIEWAERAGNSLPPPDLAVTLAYPGADTRGEFGVGRETKRILQVVPGTSAGEVLAASLQQQPDERRLSP